MDATSSLSSSSSSAASSSSSPSPPRRRLRPLPSPQVRRSSRNGVKKLPRSPSPSPPPSKRRASKSLTSPQPRVTSPDDARPRTPRKIPAKGRSLPADLWRIVMTFVPVRPRLLILSRVSRTWRTVALESITSLTDRCIIKEAFALRLFPLLTSVSLYHVRNLSVSNPFLPLSLYSLSEEYADSSAGSSCLHSSYSSLRSLSFLSLQINCRCSQWLRVIENNATTLTSLHLNVSKTDIAFPEDVSRFFQSFHAPSLRHIAATFGSGKQEETPLAIALHNLLQNHAEQLISLSLRLHSFAPLLERVFSFLYPSVTSCSLRVPRPSDSLLNLILLSLPNLQALDLFEWPALDVRKVSHCIQRLADNEERAFVNQQHLEICTRLTSVRASIDTNSSFLHSWLTRITSLTLLTKRFNYDVLQHAPKLHTLDVWLPASLTMPALDKTPSSLVSLTVRLSTDFTLGQVTSFLSRLLKLCPHLKTLAVKTPYYIDLLQLATIIRQAEKADVTRMILRPDRLTANSENELCELAKRFKWLKLSFDEEL